MSKPTRKSEDELRAIADAELRQSVGYWSGRLANQRQLALAYYLGQAKYDLSPPEIEGRSTVVSTDVRNTVESMLPQLMVKFSGSDRVVEFEATKPGDEEKADLCTDYINHLFYVRNAGERIAYNWLKDALISKVGLLKVWWDTRHEESREEYVGLTDIELAQLMDDAEIEVLEQSSYPDEEDEKKRAEAIEQLQRQMQAAQEYLAQPPAGPQGAPMQPGNGQPSPGQQKAAQDAQMIPQRIAQIQATAPKMLFDVTCRRKREGGRIRVENLPPEEFLISRDAKAIEDARFVAHRVSRTISELRSMGYPDSKLDQIGNGDTDALLNMERIERMAWDDEQAGIRPEVGMDEAQRMVWVAECYLRVDADGDGIAELRRIVKAGNAILENEIVDVAPFVAICPIPLPHRFFGLSVADLAMETQRVKTAVMRGLLDGLSVGINGRFYAVEGQVNLDDLLTSRPGGVVRIKQPGAVGKLDQLAGDTGFGMAVLEYMQGFNEEATGWTRYNSGNDGDSLNATATGVNAITNRADMRLDLIARNCATGFRDLFRLMLKLVSQYQAREDIVKLRGEWVPINPREWRNGFDVSINVGLGTGNKDQQVQHLMVLGQQQQFGLQIGTVTPRNVYETQAELVRALGFKSADKFFTDPQSGQVPPAPNPIAAQTQAMLQVEQAKARAAAEVEQIKAAASAQVEQAKLQLQAQIEQQKAAAQQQVDVVRQRAEMEQYTAKIAAEAEMERLRAEMKAQLERERMQADWLKAKLASDTQILLGLMKTGAPGADQVPDVDGVTNALASLRAAVAQMSAEEAAEEGAEGAQEGEEGIDE